MWGGMFNLAPAILLIAAMILFSAAFGVVFSVRVGGADMPITISLLNSLSGVAAAIAGFAVNDILLVAVGGIVGASGLFLTQIMCKAMNRKLFDILLGKTSSQENKKDEAEKLEPIIEPVIETISEDKTQADPIEIIKNAKQVIIVPGYGMALAHAQHLVKQFAGKLTKNGATVKYAVHPVAGRMPGHMDVLLIEAGVPFDDVYEMDDINDEFKNTDLTIVVGANDVLNPAARNAEGTPIYGMPILNVDECKNIIFFNYDLKPGYSGVDNPIYLRKTGVWIFEGDAAVTLPEIMEKIL
jgi:NAD(P) transhydrogenase subunit beta